MESIRIACGQFTAVSGDRGANLEVMKKITREASEDGCDLILFPEMAVTGYLSPKEMPKLAENADGPSREFLSRVARENGIALVYGFPELIPGRERKANTFLMLGKDGEEVGRYRKIHLWDTEAEWCDPGTEIPLFSYGGASISGWICYDTRFPELARMEALAGAEIMLVPTAWLGPAAEWELALRARALDNTCFIAGSDLINRVDGLICRGLSLIVGPHGEILARAEPGTDCFIAATLDPELMASQRTRVPLKRDRVPELYGPLVSKNV